MTTRLGSLSRDDIDAPQRHLPGMRYLLDLRQHLDTGFVSGRDIWCRVSERMTDCRHSFFQGYLHQLADIGSRGDEADAERPRGTLPGKPDLLPQPVRTLGRPGSDQPQPTGLRHRCSQLARGRAGHGGTDDGMLDSQYVA
jgi:hypothetical protein